MRKDNHIYECDKKVKDAEEKVHNVEDSYKGLQIDF